MNGWQRVGIVLSALWVFCVIGYAIYERYSLPIKFFDEETKEPDISWYSKPLLFFDFGHYSVGEISPQLQRYWQAKTDEEKRVAQADFDRAASATRTVYETELKSFFWLCLLGPIAALWVLSYAVVYVSRWVISGFAGSRKE